MKNSSEKIVAALQPVFRRIHSWLERDGASRIIVARETIKELKQQELPDHLKIIHKKRRGKRRVIRKRRHYDEFQLRIAAWPQDKMDENLLPFICCVVSGSVDLNIADYILQCQAGDWILFPAGVAKADGTETHFHGNPEGRCGDILWLMPLWGGIHCWVCHSEGKEHCYKENSRCSIERRFLEQQFLNFCEEAVHSGDIEVIEQMLMLILIMLNKELNQGNIMWSAGSRFHYHEESRQHDPIGAALAYIEDNLDRHLTISTVARQILVSPATFTRRFKERTGKTFAEYQTERRISIAERMLAETNIPVNDICARIGLKYERLRLLFHKKHKCSPSIFRRKRQKRLNSST